MRVCVLTGVVKPLTLLGVIPIFEPSLVTSIILEVSVKLLTLITEFGVSKGLLLTSDKAGVEGKADKPNCSSVFSLLLVLVLSLVLCVKFFLAEAFKADFKYGLAGLNLLGVVKSIKCIEEFLSTFADFLDVEGV